MNASAAKQTSIINNKLILHQVWSIETDDFLGRCGDGPYPLLRTIMNDLNGGLPPVTRDPNNTPIPAFTKSTKKPATDSPTENSEEPEVTGAAQTLPPENPKTDLPENPITGTNGEFVCSASGFFKDPLDRQKFHECVAVGNGLFNKFIFKCGEGTVYDENLRVCNFPN